MDDYQQAKREFDLVVSNALEDSPSRQLARQKLQKVRSLRGGAASSPLYHAVLEDMIGGLGSTKKGRNNSNNSNSNNNNNNNNTNTNTKGFAIFYGRKVARSELAGASLYRLARLYMLDAPTHEQIPESSIDVFNLPPAPTIVSAAPARLGDPEKARAVESSLKNKRTRLESTDDLRQQKLENAKKSRTAELTRLEERERTYSARLLHLETRTNVSLHSK